MTAEEYFEKGVKCYEECDYEKAIFFLEKVISLKPNNTLAYMTRGAAKAKLKKFSEAIKDFDKAIKLDRNFAEAYYNRGISKRELKKHKGALNDFNKAIELDKNFLAAFNGLASLKIDLGDYEGAINNCNKSLELNSNDHIIYSHRGLAKYNLDDHMGAIQDCNISIELNSNNELAYNTRGMAKVGLKDYENGNKDYDKAIEIDPKFALPWNNKIAIYFSQKKFSKALNCLFRSNYLGYFHSINQDTLYRSYPLFPFFVFRQIQNKLKPNQYHIYIETIKLVINDCKPIYTFITYQSISKYKNYEKDLWQRMLGAINYYCGDPIISFSIFRNFIKDGSITLADFYYIIVSCLEFFENTNTYVEKALLITEPLKQKNYTQPPVQSKNLSFDILQLYYAGLIYELNDMLEDAVICFEKISDHFLPAKYKQMELLFELGNEKASEIIRQEIKDQELNLDVTTSFVRGLKEHTFDLQEDRIEELLPHYFHYLEIESAIDHFVEKSEPEIEFDLEYPGFQPNFWDLFKVNPEDIEQTRIKVNADDLLKEYEKQIEQYGKSFDALNPPNSIEINIDFKQTFKLLKDLSKEELMIDLGLHIQKFEHGIKQYEELSTYFMLKGELTHYEKLLLDFYAAIISSNQKNTSESGLAGVGEVIENYVSEYLSQLSMLVAGAITKLSPLVSAALGATGQIFAIFAAGALAELFKIHYHRLKSLKIQNFIDFKKDFEWTIAQEKERLGDKFEKRYPIHELYK